MPIQLNVSQQNAKLKAEIRRIAGSLDQHPGQFAWSVTLLQSHGLSIRSGILVRLFETPTQDGNLVGGLWLTDAKEFWEFAAVVSRSDGHLLNVEQFENVTSSVALSASGAGTGKSFGFLAVEVLGEMRGA
jgi:hypothetical protein